MDDVIRREGSSCRESEGLTYVGRAVVGPHGSGSTGDRQADRHRHEAGAEGTSARA